MTCSPLLKLPSFVTPRGLARGVCYRARCKGRPLARRLSKAYFDSETIGSSILRMLALRVHGSMKVSEPYKRIQNHVYEYIYIYIFIFIYIYILICLVDS